VYSRSVDEHNLSWGPPVTSFYIYKTLNAMARSLRFVRDNGHLLAYERVKKRGLSRIGSADDGDESGTKCHVQSGNWPITRSVETPQHV